MATKATKKAVSKATSKATAKAGAKSSARAAKPMTKAQLIQEIAEANEGTVSKQHVKAVLESLEKIGQKQLKKEGVFTVPGFAKFRVVKKKATPERMGRNPATGEPMVIKAKPASKSLRVRPVKACKEAIA